MTNSRVHRSLRRNCHLASRTLTVGVWIAVLVTAPGQSFAGVGSWTTHGPGGGLLISLEVDPLTPSTLYAATEVGVFKSTNGGAAWSATNAGLPDLEIRCLAIDPQTPSTLYAGAGGNIVKSVDAGATWSPASAGLPPITHVLDIAIDPQTPTTLYAAVGQGNSNTGPAVFKSTNGGGSWVQIATGFNATRLIVRLVIDPVTPSTLYAADFLGMVYKSSNAGGSWSPVLPSTLGSVYDLAIDPQTPATLYAATGAPQFIGRVYKSVNGGASWTPTTIEENDNAVYALAVDPTAPAVVYAATDRGVYRSANGGGTWSPRSTGLMNFDVLALRIDPQTPATLYAPNGLGGVFKTTNAGTTWSTSNTGLPGASVLAVAVDPEINTRLYAATEADGVQRSSDAGASWADANVGLPPNTTMTAVVIDPQAPATVYAGANRGVFKSVDRGATWLATGPGPTDVRSLAVDPHSSAVLYAGTTIDGLFKSGDGGATWNPANAGLSMFMVNAIVADPTVPGTLYAGGTNVLAGAGVYKSVDGGGSWSPLNGGLSNTFVTALVADPNNPATLYAGTFGGVFVLANGGQPWVAINNGLADLNVSSIVVAGGAPPTLYAGTMGGVFKSSDGGASWSPLNAGLSPLAVAGLALDPLIPTTVYAAASGSGGVFDLQQPQCGNGLVEVSEACDDGANNGSADSCCTVTCTLQADGDGDGLCDAHDPCTDPDHSSDFLPKAKLQLARINTETTPGNDKLSLTGSFALPAGQSFADLDPMADGARVVVTRHNGSIVIDAVVATGAYAGSGTRGWKLNGSGSAWTFADRTDAPAYGITDLKLIDQSGKAPGRVRAKVKGKNGTYPVVAGDEPLTAIVLFGDQTAGPTDECAQTMFDEAACTFNASGSKLKCRQ